MDANKKYGEKAWQKLYKNCDCNIEHVLEVTPYKEAVVRPPTTYYENYPS